MLSVAVQENNEPSIDVADVIEFIDATFHGWDVKASDAINRPTIYRLMQSTCDPRKWASIILEGHCPCCMHVGPISHLDDIPTPTPKPLTITINSLGERVGACVECGCAWSVP